MKKIVLLNCLLLFAVTCLQSQDYIVDYHPSVYKAEMLVLSGDQSSAFTLYKNILSKYEHVFARDLHNAIICGIQSGGDTELIYGWFKRLFMIGVKEDFLRVNIVAKVKDKALRQKIEQSWIELKTTRDAQTDSKLRSKLDQFFADDQKFRARPGGYTKFKDSIRKADRKNMTDLISLIKKSGFPSEQHAGIEKPTDRPAFYIVLHHYCQAVSNQKDYYRCCDETITLIENAVKNGKMNPSAAKTYINWSGVKGNFSSASYKMTTDKAAKDKINVYRKSIGLPSVEDEEKRQVLLRTWKTNDYLF